MKSIIISRVSTEEQKEAGNSLPAQESRQVKYCHSKGFVASKKNIYSFDESAYKDKRDTFDEILDGIINTKEKIAVCFDKVDRLSRNIFDKRVSQLYEMALADKIELHFVSDGQIINSKLSAVEKFNFSISLGLAKYYSDAISDNTKRALEGKLQRGELPGKAPFGYKNITIDDKNKDIVVDPYNSKIIQRIYSWYASGAYSMKQVVDKLEDQFNLKWGKSTLEKVLKNEFYVGVINRKGKSYDHKYTWILERPTWDKVQKIKDGRNKKKFKLAGLDIFHYRGVLRCDDCGCAITNERHKGLHYYHCTQYHGKHGAKWLRGKEITKQFADLFDRFKIPDEEIDKILTNLKQTHESKNDFYHQQFKKLTTDSEKYENRIEKLYDDYADGCITKSEYTKRYERYKQKQRIIRNKLHRLSETDDNYYATVTSLVELSQRAGELFKNSRPDEKRQLLNLVLSNLRVKGKKVLYEVQKPFDTILECNDSLSWGG